MPHLTPLSFLHASETSSFSISTTQMGLLLTPELCSYTSSHSQYLSSHTLLCLSSFNLQNSNQAVGSWVCSPSPMSRAAPGPRAQGPSPAPSPPSPCFSPAEVPRALEIQQLHCTNLLPSGLAHVMHSLSLTWKQFWAGTPLNMWQFGQCNLKCIINDLVNAALWLLHLELDSEGF